MKYIQTLPPDQKIRLKNQFEEIANYNREWFFGENFHNIVANELKVNLDLACTKIKNHIGTNYRKIRLSKNKRRTESIDILQADKSALSWIRKNRIVKKI